MKRLHKPKQQACHFLMLTEFTNTTEGKKGAFEKRKIEIGLYENY